MKQKFKAVLSCILAICMVVSGIPFVALGGNEIDISAITDGKETKAVSMDENICHPSSPLSGLTQFGRSDYEDDAAENYPWVWDSDVGAFKSTNEFESWGYSTLTLTYPSAGIVTFKVAASCETDTTEAGSPEYPVFDGFTAVAEGEAKIIYAPLSEDLVSEKSKLKFYEKSFSIEEGGDVTFIYSKDAAYPEGDYDESDTMGELDAAWIKDITFTPMNSVSANITYKNGSDVKVPYRKEIIVCKDEDFTVQVSDYGDAVPAVYLNGASVSGSNGVFSFKPEGGKNTVSVVVSKDGCISKTMELYVYGKGGVTPLTITPVSGTYNFSEYTMPNGDKVYKSAKIGAYQRCDLSCEFDATAGASFAVDFYISAEGSSWDNLFVEIPGVTDGAEYISEPCYNEGDTEANLKLKTLYITIPETGHYTASLYFTKDSSGDRGLDAVYVKSAQLVQGTSQIDFEYDQKMGRVFIDGNYIASGGSLPRSLNPDDEYIYYAVPNPGYEFIGWLYDENDDLDSYTSNNPWETDRFAPGAKARAIFRPVAPLPEVLYIRDSNGNIYDLLQKDYIDETWFYYPYWPLKEGLPARIYYDPGADPDLSYVLVYKPVTGTTDNGVDSSCVTTTFTLNGEPIQGSYDPDDGLYYYNIGNIENIGYRTDISVSASYVTTSGSDADKIRTSYVTAETGATILVKKDDNVIVSEFSSPVSVENNDEFKWVSSSMSDDDTEVFESGNAGIGYESSTISFTVDGTGVFCYDFFVSSEAGWDKLFIYVDGVERGNYSGELGWNNKQTINISKPEGQKTTVSFSYEKDGSGDSGEDKAAIRNILYSQGNVDITLAVDGGDYGSISAECNGGGLGLGKHNLSSGSEITLKAVPSANGQFYGWYADGELLSVNPTYKYGAVKTETVKALFAPKGYYAASLRKVYYTTVSEALSKAESGDTVTILSDATLTSSAEIKSGVTLLVPCMDNDTGYKKVGDIFVNPNGTTNRNDWTTVSLESLYRTLTIPEGVTLTVNGTLLVNAVTGRCVAGSSTFYNITGGYGKIALAGNIVVKNGGIIDCAGRVEGTGQVTLESGAQMFETYAMKRWRGGSYSSAQLNYVYPIYEVEMNTCRATLRINSGASLWGTLKVYSGGKYYASRIPQIHNTNGLYRLGDGAYCIRTVAFDSKINDYRDTYKFYGGATLTSSLMDLGITTINTNTCGYFTVDGDMRFELHDGTYTVTDKFEFLPGFEMTVENANVNVLANGGLLFADTNFYTYDSQYGEATARYPVRPKATINLDGKSSINVASDGQLAADDIIVANGGSFDLADGAYTSVKTWVAAGAYSSGGRNQYTVGLKINGITMNGKTAELKDASFGEMTWSDAAAADVAYTNDWTKAKAESVIENYAAICEKLGFSMDNLFDVIFSNGTLSELLNILTTAQANIGDDMKAMMLKVGVDVSKWADIETNFPDLTFNNGKWSYKETEYDGNYETFVDILSYVCGDLSDVLGFTLTKNNLNVMGNITVCGYEGYQYTLAYLLEAFGADGLTQAEYAALYADDPMGGFSYVLKAIIGEIKDNLDDASKLLSKLPTLAYFIESDGMTTVLKNLFAPVKVVASMADPVKYTSDFVDEKLDDILAGILPEGANVSVKSFDGAAVGEVVSAFLSKKGINGTADILAALFNALSDADSKTEKSSEILKDKFYTVTLDNADILTIVINAVLDILCVDGNAKALGDVLGIDLEEVSGAVMDSKEPEVFDINWSYIDSVAKTKAKYTNDWTKEKAQYIDTNLDTVVLDILKALDPEITSVSDLTDGISDLYCNDATVNMIAMMLKSAVSSLGTGTAALIGELLDCDFTTVLGYKDTDAYGVKDKATFITAAANVIAPVDKLVKFLLLGTDYKFFHDDTVTIYGAEGYKNGIIPILEALGCDLSDINDETIIKDILRAVLNRVDDILSDPLNKSLEVLPTLIYFVNAGGITAALKDMTAAVEPLLEAYATATGTSFDISEMLGFNVESFTFEDLFKLLSEKTGIELSPDFKTFLTSFNMGTKTEFTSANGKKAYKLAVSDRADLITVLIPALMELVEYKDNAKATDSLFGTDGFVENLVNSEIFKGIALEYEKAENAGYYKSADKGEQYVKYNNDWTEEKAVYFSDNLNALISELEKIAGKKLDLTELVNIYTDDTVNKVAMTLQSVVALVADKLGESAVGLFSSLLDCDLETVYAYTEKEYGVKDSETFCEAMAQVLEPVERIIEFALLGNGYEFLSLFSGSDAIVIREAEGYKYGIAPVLRALGIQAETYTTGKALTEGVLGAVCTKLDAIVSDPVNEIIDILPEIIYFINSGEFKASVNNTLMSVFGISSIVEAFTGEKLDMSAVTAIAETKLSDLVKLIEDNTGLDIPDTVTEKINNFFFGELKDGIAVYSKADSKADMLTIILSVLLETALYGDNAAQLDKLLGTDGLVGAVVASGILKGIVPEYAVAKKADYYKTAEKTNKYLLYDNDWTTAKAQYIDANLDAVIAELSKLAGVDIDLSTAIDIYSDDTVNAVGNLLKDVLSTLTEALGEKGTEAVSKLVDCDLSAILGFTEISGKVTDADSFKTEMSKALAPAERILGFLLLNKGYKFFLDNAGNDQIIVNGAEGYTYGVAPILKALGIETGEYETTEALIAGLLDSLCTRLDEVTEDPINEILALLPEVIYFINSGEFEASVKNIFSGALALANALTEITGKTIDVSMIDDAAKLTLSDILKKAEETTGLDINDALVGGIDNFFFGELKDGKAVYSKDESRADMITVIISAVIETMASDGNAEKLDELLGTDGLINKIVSSEILKGIAPEYVTAENTGYTATAETGSEYLKYDNNWNKKTAEYVTNNLGTILDQLSAQSGKTADLSSFIDIYSDDTVNKVAMLLQKVTAQIVEKTDETALALISELLDCDLVTVYKYTEKTYGVKDSATFRKALTDILAPVERLIEFLLLDNDIELFNDFAGNDEIIVSGAKGYEKGIAPMLNALGIEAGEYTTGKALTEGILGAVCGKLDEVLASPEALLDLIPELVYFVNSGEFKAAVLNTFAGAYALSEAVEVITGQTLNLSDIDSIAELKLSDIAALAEEKTGIDIADDTVAKLDNFFFGEVKDGKAVFNCGADKSDLVTVIVSVLLETLKDSGNADALKALIGDKAYETLRNVLELKLGTMSDISWLHAEDADTGKVFSGVESSDIYSDIYGSIFTKEQAQYIADNISDFADVVVKLLGIEIEGEPAKNLGVVFSDLVATNIYTKSTADEILGFIKLAVSKIEAMPAGEHIKAVIKTSTGADLYAYANMVNGEFSDGDREAFTEAILNMMRPLYPVIEWVLCEKDMSFFTGKDGKDLVVLPGGQGYNYGVIPVLEALFCENIKTADEYYKDVAVNKDALILDILSVVFDKLDYITEDPAERIFEILPNIAYFINSEGLDVCFRNIVNPVISLLKALEPLTGEIDVYDILGVELDTIDFNDVAGLLIGKLTSGTGIELEELSINAVAELTTGTIESFTSLNGRKACRMVYDEAAGSKADMVTTVLELGISFVINGSNSDRIKTYLKENVEMSESAYKFVCGVIDITEIYATSSLGVSTILSALYYIFKTVETGVVSIDGALSTANGRIDLVFKAMESSGNSILVVLGKTLSSVLGSTAGDIITDEGIAPKGIIAFITRIISVFKKIVSFIKNLF